VGAEADLAIGSVAAAAGHADAAETIGRAVAGFGRLSIPYGAARARLALARSLAATEPDDAVEEARQALAGFERLGAMTDTDAAAAFLRGLGVRGRTGPKRPTDPLTKRESEVLQLLARDLRTRRSPRASTSARRPRAPT
jgi:hypothetical protein